MISASTIPSKYGKIVYHKAVTKKQIRKLLETKLIIFQRNVTSHHSRLSHSTVSKDIHTGCIVFKIFQLFVMTACEAFKPVLRAANIGCEGTGNTESRKRQSFFSFSILSYFLPTAQCAIPDINNAQTMLKLTRHSQISSYCSSDIQNHFYANYISDTRVCAFCFIDQSNAIYTGCVNQTINRILENKHALFSRSLKIWRKGACCDVDKSKIGTGIAIFCMQQLCFINTGEYIEGRFRVAGLWTILPSMPEGMNEWHLVSVISLDRKRRHYCSFIQ